MSGNKAVVKKGRCLNIGNCNKANTKEIIEVNIGEDFICPECGGELVEVKPKKSVLPYIVGGVVVVALVVVGLMFGLKGGESPVEDPGEEPEMGISSGSVDSLDVDTSNVAVEASGEDAIKPETEKAGKTSPSSPRMGTLNFDYGTYVGSISGGKANGLGTLTYTKRHRISTSDSQERFAEPGDYVKGDFENNEVKTVKWYGADNKLKGAIFAGSNGL